MNLFFYYFVQFAKDYNKSSSTIVCKSNECNGTRFGISVMEASQLDLMTLECTQCICFYVGFVQ